MVSGSKLHSVPWGERIAQEVVYSPSDDAHYYLVLTSDLLGWRRCNLPNNIPPFFPSEYECILLPAIRSVDLIERVTDDSRPIVMRISFYRGDTLYVFEVEAFLLDMWLGSFRYLCVPVRSASLAARHRAAVRRWYLFGGCWGMVHFASFVLTMALTAKFAPGHERVAMGCYFGAFPLLNLLVLALLWTLFRGRRREKEGG